MLSPVFPNAVSSPDAVLRSLLSPSERADAQSVADYCRARLDLNAAAQMRGAEPAYAHLPLCVIDAVWSLSVRYESVRNVVVRYIAHAGLGGQNTNETPAHSIDAFVRTVEAVGVDDFASLVLRNKQRTASKSGILKADAVYRFALVLQEHGAQTVADVPEKLRGNARFEQAVLAIPGQGSGLSLRYFYMVCGAPDLTKPDRMVFRFLQAALSRPIGGASEAQSLLTNVCLFLRSDFPTLSPHSLDNALWKFEREKAGTANNKDGAGDAAVPDAEANPDAPTPDAAPAESPFAAPPILPTVPEAAPTNEKTPRETAPAIETRQSDKTPETRGEATAQAEETGENEGDALATYRVRLRELPADDRPRERLLQYGADVLSLGELLAILLRSGTQQQNVVELANHLLSHYGGLRGVAALTAHELAQINGIGPAKAAQIKAAIEFGRRLVASSPEERTKISGPRDVYHQVGLALRDEKREHFIALLLDTKNGLLRQITVSVGDLSSSLVHPREVFTPAVRYSAASIIVSHNHPSGDPTPSPEDVQVTARLVEAGELLGITLLDHIIVGDARWVSLKEKGLM